MPISATLLAVALAVQTAPPPSADAAGRAYFLFMQARSLAESEDLTAAIERYRQALALVGDSSDVRTDLAMAYARLNRATEAREEAERAVALDDTNRAAHRILGLIEASELEASESRPSDPALARATMHLERALAGGFEDPAAQLTLADLYVRGGQHQKAIDTLNDFLLDRPGYLQAVLLLAQAYRAAGQPAEAERVLGDLGGSGRPDPAAAARQQALALANSGQLSEARDVLSRLIATNPDDIAAYYLLAQVELRDGQADAAEGAALRIARIDPDDVRGPLMLAEVRARRNNFRGVVEALEPRVTAATDADVETGAYTQMTSLLASAFVGLGEGKRAVQVLETARKRAPADLHVLFSLAATYERTGDVDRAEQAFRELLAADPSHAPGLNHLGYMLAERGRKLDEAVSLINRALVLDADNPSYLDSLGWAYFKQARYTEAVSPLERAAAGAPESSVIQDHLGDLYIKLRRYRDAEAAFTRALDGDGDAIDLTAIRKKRDEARALAGAN
jgi:tetratricopeptide (TPR) repeat protein